MTKSLTQNPEPRILNPDSNDPELSNLTTMNIVFPVHIPKKRHSRGDLNEFGMLFWGKRKSCPNGEHWITPEQYKEWTERARARFDASKADPDRQARNLAAVRKYRLKKATPPIPRVRLPKTIRLWDLIKP